MSSGRKPPVWKKPKSKIYDYNYNLGEHYYKPQLAHMESKYGQNKGASPPRARTFAERFAADPIYGSNAGLDYRTTAERPYESTPSSTASQRRTSLQDDMMGSFGRKPLFESSRGFSPEADDFRPSRPRLNLGDRLLDAAGTGGFGGRQGIFGELGGSANVQEDPFDDPFFASRKKLLPPRSADPDFMTEDPFKKRFGSMSNMEDDADNMVRDFKRDSESVVAGFRSRMQARRQREEESNSNELESSGIESRVDKIRARAKARMAELEDDLPALSLRSSESANRARALLRDIDDMDSSSAGLSSSLGSSKTLRITKRTIKASVETDCVPCQLLNC